MEKIRITSLKQLKQWNATPTAEKPIVLEWFMDWFFDKVLMRDKKELAIDAYNTMVEFAEICEKMDKESAIQRTNSNLRYYAGYAGAWQKKLKKYFPDIY